MDAETLKAINNVNKRINEVESKLDFVIQLFNKQTNEKVDDNTLGLEEIASITSDHNEAILELAEIIGGME